MVSEKKKMALHEKYNLYQNIEKIKYKDKFVSLSDVQKAEKELKINTDKYFQILWDNEKIDKNYKNYFLGD